MCLRTTPSLATDPQRAVNSLHRTVARPDRAMVLRSCSGRFDLDALDRVEDNDHEP